MLAYEKNIIFIDREKQGSLIIILQMDDVLSVHLPVTFMYTLYKRLLSSTLLGVILPSRHDVDDHRASNKQTT